VHLQYVSGEQYFTNSTTPSVPYLLNSDTNWHHACCTIDYINGTIKFYIDGSLFISYDVTLSSYSSIIASPIAFGNSANTYDDSSCVFSGYLDEAFVFKYILTDLQVQYLYEHPQTNIPSVSLPNPFVYYNFENYDGNSAYLRINNIQPATKYIGVLKNELAINNDESKSGSFSLFPNGGSANPYHGMYILETWNYTAINNGLTLSAWYKIKIDSDFFPPYPRVFEFYIMDDNDHSLCPVSFMTNINNVHFYFLTGEQYFTNSTNPSVPYQLDGEQIWHHACCTVDYANGCIKFYIDGTIFMSYDVSFNNFFISSPIQFGQNARDYMNGSNFDPNGIFPGYIDNTGIYYSVLNAKQIKKLYDNP
jgi:hypothetical protein